MAIGRCLWSLGIVVLALAALAWVMLPDLAADTGEGER